MARMHTEEVVGLVLGALHPRLRERCSEAKILSVLEDDCGAYDVETANARRTRERPDARDTSAVCGVCAPHGRGRVAVKFRAPVARARASP